MLLATPWTICSLQQIRLGSTARLAQRRHMINIDSKLQPSHALDQPFLPDHSLHHHVVAVFERHILRQNDGDRDIMLAHFQI